MRLVPGIIARMSPIVRLWLLLSLCQGTLAQLSATTGPSVGPLAIYLNWTDANHSSYYVEVSQSFPGSINYVWSWSRPIVGLYFTINLETISEFAINLNTAVPGHPELVDVWRGGEQFRVWVGFSLKSNGRLQIDSVAWTTLVYLLGTPGAPKDVGACAYDDAVSSLCDGLAYPTGVVQVPNSIRVTWIEPDDLGFGPGTADGGKNVYISSYKLQAAPTTAFNESVIEEDQPGDKDNTAKEYVFSFDLPRGIQYFVRIRAANAMGDGEWSAAYQLPLAIQEPSPPVLTALAPGTVGGNYITALFTRPDDSGDLTQFGINVTKYSAEVSVAADFAVLLGGSAVEQVATQAVNQQLVLRIAGMVTGVEYFVRVRAAHGAFGSDQYGNYSNVLNASIVGAPGLLEAVSLQVSGALALSATWKAPLDFGFGIGNPYPLLKYQYSVYTDPVAGPDAGTVVDVAVTAPFSAQLSSLTQGVVYYVSARAQNDAGENGGFGPWFNATAADCSSAPVYNRSGTCGVMAVTLPSAVQGLSVVRYAPELLINWTRPLDTGGGDQAYALEQYEVLVSGGGTSGTYEVSALLGYYRQGGFDPGSVFRVYVRAINVAGAGPWLDDQYTALLFPSAPPDLTVNGVGVNGLLGSVNVSFGSPNNTGLGNNTWPLVEMQVQATPLNATNGGPAPCVEPAALILGPAERRATVSELTKGCAYAIRVAAVNEAGPGEEARAVAVLVFTSGPPSRINATSGNQTLDVAWSVPDDTGHGFGYAAKVLSYEIVSAFVPGFDAHFLDSATGIQSHFYQLRSAFCADIYFRIRAVTRVGVGEWSETRSARPNNCTVEIDFFCTAGFYLLNSRCRICPTFSTSPDFSLFLSNCSCAPGYTGSDPTNCTACAAGEYKELLGPQACDQCPGNATSNPASPLSSNCTCVEGYTGPGGLVPCVMCEAGRYKDVVGSQACTLCPVASYLTYRAAVSSAECLACPSNSSSPEGSELLTNCSCIPGSSGPYGGPCPLCAPGTYKPVSGDENCTACPDGTFREKVGGVTALDCSSCPIYSAALDGGVELEDCRCVPGTFGPGGGTSCSLCAPLEFTDEYNSTGCEVCNTTTCDAIGSYREACPNVRDAECVPCTNGPFDIVYTSPGTGVGDSNCEWECAPGYYNDTASSCKKCEQPCPVGEYLSLCECVPCSNWKPPGAHYTSAGHPLGFDRCDWSCGSGLDEVKDADTCQVRCLQS